MHNFPIGNWRTEISSSPDWSGILFLTRNEEKKDRAESGSELDYKNDFSAPQKD